MAHRVVPGPGEWCQLAPRSTTPPRADTFERTRRRARNQDCFHASHRRRGTRVARMLHVKQLVLPTLESRQPTTGPPNPRVSATAASFRRRRPFLLASRRCRGAGPGDGSATAQLEQEVVRVGPPPIRRMLHVKPEERPRLLRTFARRRRGHTLRGSRPNRSANPWSISVARTILWCSAAQSTAESRLRDAWSSRSPPGDRRSACVAGPRR